MTRPSVKTLYAEREALTPVGKIRQREIDLEISAAMNKRPGAKKKSK